MSHKWWAGMSGSSKLEDNSLQKNNCIHFKKKRESYQRRVNEDSKPQFRYPYGLN